MPGTRFIVSVARGRWPEGVTIMDAQGTPQFEVTGSSASERLASRSGWPATADLLRLSSPRIMVDITPGNETAIMLAAVLAIEWLCEESKWPYWLHG